MAQSTVILFMMRTCLLGDQPNYPSSKNKDANEWPLNNFDALRRHIGSYQ